MSNQESAQFVVMRVARTVVLLPLLLFPMLASAQAQSTATAAQVAGANAKTNPTGTPPILSEKSVVGRGLGPFEFKGSLSKLPKTDPRATSQRQFPLHGPLLPGRTPGGPAGGPPDPLLKLSPAASLGTNPFIPAPTVQFEGIDGGNPPDTNGVVGPNHYIQTINVSFKIWDKTGTILAGPTSFTTLFAASPATGTPCDNGFTSDPVVLYDAEAERFVLTILALPGIDSNGNPIPPFYECIAVSKTSDPVNGGWFKYALLADSTTLNDFPKLGVWPDAYYMTANMNGCCGGGTFVRAWALDRNSILVGGILHEQHFDIPSGFNSVLPSNLSGAAPPAGAPNVFAAIDFNDNNIVDLWNFHVDWITPSKSTFGDGSHNPDNTVTVANYTHLTASIPQPGTNVVFLDPLGDRANAQAQYRNIGGVESLWVDHPVDTGSNVSGIRWYEIHSPASSPTLNQQGTWNNGGDGIDRWMGSIGVDQFGNMLIGYNVSDANSVNPGIRYGGRLVSDPLGTFGLAEGTLTAGLGNIINCKPDTSKGQTTCTGRWGDYSGMSIDPVDDCTFWFTDEYVNNNNNNNVPRTRIGAVALLGCNADLSIVKTAATSVAAGTNLTYSITVTNNGPVNAQFVTFNDSTPAGTTFVGLAQTSGPTFNCSTPFTGGTGPISCGIKALNTGVTATFSLLVNVDSNAQGTLTNTASVTAYELDPDPSNNTSTINTVVIQSADLSVAKTCKPDGAALAGSTAFCSIVVSNSGPSDAQNVVLTDTLFSLINYTITSVVGPGCPGGPFSSPVTCFIGTLAAGTSTTVTVYVTSKTPGDVNDTATVSSSTPDPNTANNSASGHVSFVASADLAISKTASATSPLGFAAGTNMTYTIAVSNAGPSTATNVVVKDTIPGQVSVVSAAPTVGSCTAGISGNPLQPLTCTLGPLANGGTATITVVANINASTPSGTVVNNNASVSSDVADPNNANNSATAGVTVVTDADLAVVKTSDKLIYKPSSTIIYSITVTNYGPSDSLAVVVTDNLPVLTQAIYKSDTGGCTKNASTPTVLNCTLGTMPVGTSKTFSVYERVNGSRGSISNTASVNSTSTPPTPDPIPANNTSTRVVTIGK